MKFTLLLIACIFSFGLISCNQDSTTHEMQMHHNHAGMQMKPLTMLVEHAISMMAQGAALKLDGSKYGDVLLSESADLLRRAMSGPEMAAMHKGGQGQSPEMQHTHALGAAAFDLLDMMMSLDSNQAPEHANMLHHALNMAAQGASMQSLAATNMGEDIDHALQEHGRHMQQMSMQLYRAVASDTAYTKAVLKIIGLLVGKTSKTMPHTHES